MYYKVNPKSFILVFVMSFSLIFLSGAAQPQEDPESSGNQPSYIDELVESSQLTQSQVDDMKKGGDSWGNIRITARMAEQIAAKNTDPEKTAEQKYQEALNSVLQQRAAGKGYGNIANENNINLGSVMGNGNGTQNQQKDKTQIQNNEQEQNRNREQTQVQQQTQPKTKKKGFLGRVFGIFSKDKKEQKQETSSNIQTQKSSTKAKTQQDVSNKVQTQNSSSSQNVKNQQRTQTNQRTQMQTGNGNSRGGGRGR